MESTPVKLTQTVQKGGCAAKVSAIELRKILSQVQFPPTNSSLLVDGSLFDDAAIFKVNDQLALVQTLDFFTPILDSAYTFGKVACANALSDVYAMGGTPQTAMAILAFPTATLSNEIIAEVLQGACDLLAEVNVPLVGGHSIDDDTLKFGLSVTGYVHPEKIWSNNKAQIGDLLILTKGLGTGTLTAALKRGEVSESEISEAIASMTQVNACIDLLRPELADAIHAATDITGFGLLGHGMQMAKASHKTFFINASDVPVLPQAKSFLEKGFLTKAHRSNRDYVSDAVDIDQLDEISKLLLFDPQTSGGLLLSVQKEKAELVLAALKTRFKSAAFIGQVVAAQTSAVVVK
ncbi:MAG: selenide, water dikinase SelD [Bdellovibrionaceae bacterium]|nr:selenide, water dikinase SelD [Bdellovibrio sp.]